MEAQIFLQMEKYGSLNVNKFSVGDELTFLLEGTEENWRTEYIENLIPQDNIIVFTNGLVNVENIIAIRSYKNARRGKSIAYGLYNFGAGWGLFSLIGSAFTDEVSLNFGTAAVVATSALAGFIIQKISKHKTYKMGKRRWLRILDMRVEPKVINP